MRLSLKQKNYVITKYKVFGSYTRLARAYSKEFKQKHVFLQSRGL